LRLSRYCGQSSRTAPRPTSVDSNLTPNRLTASRGIRETGTSTLCLVQPEFGVLVRRPPLQRTSHPFGERPTGIGRRARQWRLRCSPTATVLSPELPQQMRKVQADQQTLHVRLGRWPSHDARTGFEVQSMKDVSQQSRNPSTETSLQKSAAWRPQRAGGRGGMLAPRPSQTGRTM
jgi:hypothetical protein